MSGEFSTRMRRVTTIVAVTVLTALSVVGLATSAGGATPKGHNRVGHAASSAAHVANHVTYSRQNTNNPPPTSTGYIEVCKFAGSAFVSGAFHVAINDGHSTINATIPLGQCTAPLQVAAGNVSVTETPVAPYYLANVITTPASALVSVSGNSAVVTVAQSNDSSTETEVDLYNAAYMGKFKVCKILTSNSGDLITSGNNVFTFNPSYELAGSNTFVTLPAVSVQVLSTGTAYCVLDQNALPLGTLVKITEQGVDNVQLQGVSVQPASQDAGSTSTTAYLRIGPEPERRRDRDIHQRGVRHA